MNLPFGPVSKLYKHMGGLNNVEGHHLRVWTKMGVVFEGAVGQGTDMGFLHLELHPGIVQGLTIGIPEPGDSNDAPHIFLQADDILTCQIIY